MFHTKEHNPKQSTENTKTKTEERVNNLLANGISNTVSIHVPVMIKL
jgi:hypothetical protein